MLCMVNGNPTPHMEKTLPNETKRNDVHWDLIDHQLIWAYAQEPPTKTINVNYRNDPACHAWLVEKGRCLINDEGRKIEARAGQWVFTRAGAFKRRYLPDSYIYAFSFQARWPHGVHLIEAPETLVIPEEQTQRLSQLAREIVREVERSIGPPASFNRALLWRQSMTASVYMGIDGAFRSWLSEFLKVMPEAGAVFHDFTGQDSRVAAAIARIDTMSVDSHVDLHELCHELGIGRRRLDDLFKNETGKGLREYYEEVLLQRICHMLLDNTRQIKEIAILAGFDHGSNFTRWFCKHAGVTPTQYRDMRKNQ